MKCLPPLLRLGALAAGALGWACASAQGTPVATPYDQTRVSSFTYQANGLIASETIEPDNSSSCVTTTYTYGDAYGNRTAASTANCAGASGRSLFTQRSTSSSFATQTVTINGASVTVPAGAFATSSTVAQSQVVTGQPTQTESRTFDPRFGVVKTLTGPNALTTTFELDDFGRKTREIRADGTRIVFFYCYIAGRVPGNDTTSNTPGCTAPGSGEIPTDAVAYIHSEPRDNAGTAGAKMGPYARTYTDRAGRAIRVATEAFDGTTQAGGTNRIVVQDTDFNPYGMVVVVTQPYFLDTGSSNGVGAITYGMTGTDYDVVGRPTAIHVVDPNGSVASQSFGWFSSRGTRRAARTQLAHNGLTTTTTDDEAKTRTEVKSVEGRVVRVTDELGAQMAHQHDAFGNLAVTKDSFSNKVATGYDLRGRKVAMTDPDVGLWTYDYNALGELVWQQAPNQRAASPTQATTMAYDLLGRMTQRIEPEYTSAWSYDRYSDASTCNKGLGKMCESSTTGGVGRRFAYDDFGRPVGSRLSVAGQATFGSSVVYEAATGRVASRIYPTGLQVNHGYTAKGFVQSLTLGTAATVSPLPSTPGGTPVAGTTLPVGSALWTSQSFNAWGRVEEASAGNGVVARAAFDPATGRPTLMTAGTTSAFTASLNHTYAWDSLGRMTQRVDGNGNGMTGQVVDAFQYDSIGRLTRNTVSAQAIAGSPRVVDLAYNALGMLLYKSDVGNYRYGPQGTGQVQPHSLQGVTGAIPANYQYDANGNLTYASAGKYSAIAYTSFNLPSSSAGAKGLYGIPQYTWLYDENHQRIRETRSSPASARTTWNVHPDSAGGLGFESESGTGSPIPTNRHYLSVGGMSIGVLQSSGVLPTLSAGQTAPPALGSITLSKVEYWHKDPLGSLVATTDHQSNTTARYAFDPFGKRRNTDGNYDAFGTFVVDWTTNTNSGGDRGFTGHEHLDDIGIVHMNGRLYDPTLGRFMQADPLIQDPLNLQNFDRYAYCYNNPVTCTDPTGTFSLRNWHRAFRNFILHAYNPRVTYIYALTHASPFAGDIEHFARDNEWAVVIGKAAAGYFSFGLGSAFISGYEMWLAGASYSDIRKMAAINAATAYAFQVVGNVADSGTLGNVFGHAVVGCASAEAQGGDCGQGAASGAVGAIASDLARNQPQYAAFAITVTAGGTAASLSGGKFSDGAMTAALGYLFNSALHDRQAGTTRAEIQGNRAAEIGCLGDYCSGAGRITDPNSIHLSITIYDNYDGISTIEGQPKINWSLDGSSCLLCLNSQTTTGLKAGVVWGPFGLGAPSGMGQDSLVFRLREYAGSYGNWSIPYRYPSPNSNWWISEGLRLTTGGVPRFGFGNYTAPGYGN